MAYEDFTTYDEADEGNNVTVISSKVSWVGLTEKETSHVSDSKGAAHFNGDFEHLFECQFLNTTLNPEFGFWALTNSQNDKTTLITISEDFVVFQQFTNSYFMFQNYINGNMNAQDYWDSASESTTYYITLNYDRDGGANGTGQYIAEIRTGSHLGTLQDTLTVDCPVGGQHDYEYIFGLIGNDVGTGGDANYADGFTQNLDLQEEETPSVGLLSEMWNW